MCELYAQRNKHLVTRELSDTLRSILNAHPHVDIVVEKIENRKMFQFFRDLFNDIGMARVGYQGYHFDKGSNFTQILSLEGL